MPKIKNKDAKRYLINFLVVTAALVLIHFSTILFTSSPIRAEYWMHEVMVVKRHLSTVIASPKIVIIGGSSTLIGIDARQISDRLQIPALNYGLHAGMRLTALLEEADHAVKQNDILVMALEPVYYQSDGSWTNWQLRNALAWDRRQFSETSFPEKIRATFEGGSPSMSLEMIADKIYSAIAPSAFLPRSKALDDDGKILARFERGALRTEVFKYSAYNLNPQGDLANPVSNLRFAGPAIPATWPGSFSAYAKSVLSSFVAEMRQRRVRVVVAHAPYIVDPPGPTEGWQDAERDFAQDVKEIGAELLDGREELFLPRGDFLNSELHLNEQGRRTRTDRMIASLQRLGIGATPR